MSTVRHGHQTGSEPRGLWRLRSVHRRRRPAQRGRGCQAFIMNTEGPPWDQDAGQHGPARRPHVTGSAGGGRRRIGLIGRANSHSKGQHVRPVLPERVCGSGVARRDTPSGRGSPARANCTLRTSVRLCHRSDRVRDRQGSVRTSIRQALSRNFGSDRRSVGRAKRGRPMTMRDRIAADAVRDVSGSPGHPCASLRSAQARSARRSTSRMKESMAKHGATGAIPVRRAMYPPRSPRPWCRSSFTCSRRLITWCICWPGYVRCDAKGQILRD
jgi:hypothetical protein